MDSYPSERTLTPCTADPLAQVFRPNPSLTNIACKFGDSEVFYYEEIEVVMEITLMVLNNFPHVPMYGTLIIDGQKRGGSADCILRANLTGGPHSLSQQYGGGRQLSSDPDAIITSDDAAEGAIDDILDSNTLSARCWKTSGLVHNIDSTRHALVLNTTNGRFLISFCADLPDRLQRGFYGDIVLLCIAKAISLMGLEDAGLQSAIREITELSENAHSSLHLQAMDAVQKIFSTCEHPVLHAWKVWHDEANDPAKGADALQLFFA